MKPRSIFSPALGLVVALLSCALAQVANCQQTNVTVSIYQAVELNFDSETNRLYRVQTSTNLSTWFDLGGVFRGNGSNIASFVSTKTRSKEFYRISELATLSQGLVAWYPFDGTAEDRSTNGNHGTSFGAVVSTNRFGMGNSSYFFDGSGVFIRIPDAPSLDVTQAISLAIWFNFEVGGLYAPRFLHKGNAYQVLTESTAASRRLSFSFEPVVSLQTSTTLDANRWYFVVVTYDGTTARIYLNGELAQQAAATGPLTMNSTDINLGRNAENGTDRYRGYLDDLRIYNRALTSDEVLLLYNVTY